MSINQSKSVWSQLAKEIISAIPIIPAPDLYDLFKKIDKSKENIETKISKAHESLTETSKLLSELQTELTERTMQVNKLSAEYERYSNLAEIKEKEVRPLLIQLDKAVNKGKYQERWISFLINIIAGIVIFVLGIWLGPKITIFLNRK